MNENVKIKWERFLNPEILRTNLIVASLFITAFEMLRDSVIERAKEFFIHGFNKDGWIISDRYKTEGSIRSF